MRLIAENPSLRPALKVSRFQIMLKLEASAPCPTIRPSFSSADVPNHFQDWKRHRFVWGSSSTDLFSVCLIILDRTLIRCLAHLIYGRYHSPEHESLLKWKAWNFIVGPNLLKIPNPPLQLKLVPHTMKIQATQGDPAPCV